MSNDVVLVIAALFAVVLLVALFKVLGNAIKALLIALIAGGILYLLLPKLEQQQGVIGDAARKALEVTDDLEGSVKGLRDQASEAGRRVSDGIDQMQEAAEVVEATKKAAERGNQVPGVASKLTVPKAQSSP
ncbi:MAG: hypothetical protein ACPGU1_11115 [Myxococcota bacterium]